MKKSIIAVLALSVLFIGGVSVYSGTVDPKSNTLGDTDATANTLVYRDSDGVFDASSLKDGTVVTAKLATNSVTTAKLYLNTSVAGSGIACVTTKKALGNCGTVSTSAGTCNCSD